MKGTPRSVAVRLLPPIAAEFIRKARHRVGFRPEWEFVSYDWPAHGTVTSGWNHASIPATQLAKWEAYRHILENPDPLGVAHEAVELTNDDHTAHNLVMTFGYVLGLASQGLQKISWLDWGGGSGQYFLLGQVLFPQLDIDYHCRDLPLLAQQGRELLPNAQFYSDDACLDRQYDLVMASTSLQYSEDWERVSAALVRATGRYLYIANLPIVEGEKSFTVVQRPHKYGYETEYVCWFLSRSTFLHRMRTLGMELVREFLLTVRPDVLRAPDHGEYRGFLFAAAHSNGERR